MLDVGFHELVILPPTSLVSFLYEHKNEDFNGNENYAQVIMDKDAFNYTYYTVAHKCNMRQLFTIPASYENNIALAKPEGCYAHARIDPLFRQPFSSLALYLCAAKFFRFSCYLI